YFSLSAAQLRASQAADARRIAERARDAAQARFDQGDAPRLEVVQTQLAVAQAENEAELAEGTLASERSRLDVLLARSPDAPLTASEDLSAGTVPPVEATEQKALEANAELGVLDRRIAEARA